MKIKGKVKFYNKKEDFGCILADDGKKYAFRISNFVQKLDGVLAPYTKVLFVPVSARNKDKKDYATEIELDFQRSQPARQNSRSNKGSGSSLPPPCPHCGARKGSHFGWKGDYDTKIYLCNACGREHTYGDILQYNASSTESGKSTEIFVRIFFVIFFIIFVTFMVFFINQVSSFHDEFNQQRREIRSHFDDVHNDYFQRLEEGK